MSVIVPSEAPSAATQSAAVEPAPAASYTVSVRGLCEFTAKRGDLDRRFTPSPTAREGMAGHSTVTSRRGANYEREVSLSARYGELEVRGRADGYDPDANRLEEIKTFRGDLNLMPENHRALHWAQVKIYGCLLCRDRNLAEIELALVYFDIVSQKETLLRQTLSHDALEAFFDAQCSQFLTWSHAELKHRENRNAAMEMLTFPYPAFREGQRQLAEAVYQAASGGVCLLAEAPTGIGKTVGTLFPLLKAMPRKGIDKIFFLCAKTPGRRLALDAMETLGTNSLRTLEVIAREKSCEHPDKACHGDACPLAQGFYDRLPAARRAAAEGTLLTQARLREVALEHHICPYYLSQEMVRWSDVIVADYNYYFDVTAMLHGLQAANQWRTAVLVDEAHNLMERAREMYSASLDQRQFRAAKRQAPAALKASLNKLNREWNGLNRQVAPEQDSAINPAQDTATGYHVLPELPQKLLFALQQFTSAASDVLTEQPTGLDPSLTQFYFDALHYLRVAELFDEQNFVADLVVNSPGSKRRSSELCLRNLIPAALLKARFEAAHTATVFSATLQPAVYYQNVLGLPDTLRHISVASPFVAEQLQVRICRDISTRYRDRATSVQPIAELIARQFDQQPGNYLAFFSSYDYLAQVWDYLAQTRPDLPAWQQERWMDEAARLRFLEQFQEDGQGIGFAVLGGAFAEGIDLPGRRLIGAFIATLGLPQTNPINELLKARMTARFGDGYNYAYLYPGLRKVVQAAGRVIRTESDRGVVFLIDDRFAQGRVQALLPPWWQTQALKNKHQ